MKMREFRTNQGLVDEIKKVFSTPDWKFLRSVLDEEHPIHEQVRDTSPGALAHRLGRVDGYQECLRLLDKAAVYIEPEKHLTETFEPPIKPDPSRL